MAFSVQNKNFLALLNRLGIDVKQFPDITFDGLFDNVPEVTNYFFNWFIENISPDNVLTQSEQSTYFQLESSQSVLLEEEMNYVFSFCNPTFEELMSLDSNYVNNFLSQELEDLTKNCRELSHIYKNLEISYNNIKNKQNNLKEKIRIRKKQLVTIQEECHKTNLSFGNKIDEVKMFLFKEPHFSIDMDIFNNLVEKKKNIFNKYKTCKLLENESSNSLKLDVLPKLEDDAACVEISMIFSKGLLTEKQAKIEFLSDLLGKSSFNESLISNNMINNEEIDSKIMEEIKMLENKLFEKIKILSHYEIKKISDHYILQKRDLNRSYLAKLNICKNYMKSIWTMNAWLLHILLRCIAVVEKMLSLKKHLHSELNEHERNFSSNLIKLEMRRQRFQEVSVQHQHPLVMALNSVMNLEDTPENNEVTFKNIQELLFQANDDSNYITHKFRSDLQMSIKMFFNNFLCGPTNQLLFAPSDLLIKLQNCKEQEGELSQTIKHLASNYVNTKKLISSSDRKKLLSWIDSLTNPPALQLKVNCSPQSLKNADNIL